MFIFFKPSDYYELGKNLNVTSEWEIKTLQETDIAIYTREVLKAITLVTLAIAAYPIGKLHTNGFLSVIVLFSTSYFLSAKCAEYLENQAKTIIQGCQNNQVITS